MKILVHFGNNVSWMNTAIGEIGTKEDYITNASGASVQKNTGTRIDEYWGEIRQTGLKGKKQSWCGGFVAWCMLKNNYSYKTEGNASLKTNPSGAANWRSFGRAIAKPVYGAIAVKGVIGSGHVAFVIGKNVAGDHLYILGGNQNNGVTLGYDLASRYTSFRLPTNYKNRYDWLPVVNRNYPAVSRTV